MMILPKTVIRSAFQNKTAIQDAPEMVKEEGGWTKLLLFLKVPGSTDYKLS